MKSIPINGATRRLGAPKNWNHETDGICHTLEILDVDGWMVSAWQPTREEIEKIINGHAVLLWINASSHPVVSVSVHGKPMETLQT